MKTLSYIKGLSYACKVIHIITTWLCSMQNIAVQAFFIANSCMTVDLVFGLVKYKPNLLEYASSL